MFNLHRDKKSYFVGENRDRDGHIFSNRKQDCDVAVGEIGIA